MKKNCCLKELEIPFTELRLQLEYARTTGADIEKAFSRRTPNITELLSEYQTIKTKLSMLQDFLFQAKLWCDTILPEDGTSCDSILKKEE